MNPFRKKVFVDTLTKSGETFNIDNAVSFTVINDGDTDCQLGYKGESTLMTVVKGTQRSFPGDSGYNYYGEMQVVFKGSDAGLIEVIKSVATLSES